MKKKYFKNKLFFKLRAILKLLKSDSYCLLSFQKYNKKSGYLESHRYNIFDEHSNDIILSLTEQFCSARMHNDNAESVVNEAKKLINIK